MREGQGQHYDLELITSQGYPIWTTISSNPLWEDAKKRAEMLREGIQELQVNFQSQS